MAKVTFEIKGNSGQVLMLTEGGNPPGEVIGNLLGAEIDGVIPRQVCKLLEIAYQRGQADRSRAMRNLIEL